LDARNDAVIAAAIEVHRNLGPGLLESSYQACLEYELLQRSIPYRREVPIPLAYKEVHLDCGYRLDFIVYENLIVEVKSIAAIEPIHVAQTLTYLRLTGFRQAFLMNFNVTLMKNGIRSYLGREPTSLTQR
jgi:GxxExxY protein